MNTVLHRDLTIQLSGNPPRVGEVAPNFTAVNAALEEVQLYSVSKSFKLLLPMPSLDTGTCALETKTFNQKLEEYTNLEVWIITKDLPFAMKRFCSVEGIKNLVPVSDFRYSEFSKAYGLELTSGVLKGLHARAVILLDEKNEVVYFELVPNISDEPNYEGLLLKLQALNS